MKIYNIHNFKEFYSRLDACEGEVRICMPDGQAFNWKRDKSLIISLIAGLELINIAKISVKLDSFEDKVSLALYAMGL